MITGWLQYGYGVVMRWLWGGFGVAMGGFGGYEWYPDR